MSFEIADYDFEDETAHLLGLFSEARDHMEAERSTVPTSRAIADFLHTIGNMQKGQVIIDLLTLTGHMESIILELKMKEMSRE